MAITRTCADLDAEINSLLADGYRLDMIMPADAPRSAHLSRDSSRIRLVSEPPATAGRSDWVAGRAGMEYRDLIPGRLGGRLIASHIRIVNAGEVSDYVHYHKIGFQVIYCKRGRIRVVYEDQGSPFWLETDDCVLQPPGIRHRVLEASAGAEVIEIGSPAEHETWVDHDLSLPNGHENPGRLFGGQRFVRHVAGNTESTDIDEVRRRDTGIREASAGFGDVQIVSLPADRMLKIRNDDLTFVFVLDGIVGVTGSGQLRAEDAAVFDNDIAAEIRSVAHSEMLIVTLFGN